MKNDNINIKRQRRNSMPALEYKQNQEVKPEEPAPLSRFQRFKKGVANFFNKITTSKLFTVLASGPIIRTAGIVLASFAFTGLAIAGMSLIAPVSLPIAIATLTLTTLSAAGGAIKDIYYTRDIRKLDKEHQLLIKNKNNVSVEQQIFKIDPKLKEDLKGSLDLTQLKRSDSVQSNAAIGKLTRSKSSSKVFAEIIAPAALNIVINYMNPISIIKTVGVAVLSMVTGTNEQHGIEKKRLELKKQISEQVNQSSLPEYKNITELEHIARKQEVQTMALKELLQQPDYFKMNSEEKTQRFNSIKQKKEQELPTIKTQKNSATSVIKDIGRANNPFNKYSPSQSANLKLSKQSPLSHSLDNIIKTKLENITDNLHKKQNNSSKKRTSRARSASVISEKSNLR